MPKINKQTIKTFKTYPTLKIFKYDNSQVYHFVMYVGTHLKEIDKRMKSETINDVLNKDIKLANNLELRGTPVFIIKDEIFFGYVGYEAMANALKD